MSLEETSDLIIRNSLDPQYPRLRLSLVETLVERFRAVGKIHSGSFKDHTLHIRTASMDLTGRNLPAALRLPTLVKAVTHGL